jgi:DNA-binding response OmpR family regulator
MPVDGDAAPPLAYKHIDMDPARRRVTVGGRDVELTAQEFQLLYVLLSNPGIVYSREALLRRVWKDDTFVTVRSVDTLVKRLRKKIEQSPAEPVVILTVWGAGYKAADV